MSNIAEETFVPRIRGHRHEWEVMQPAHYVCACGAIRYHLDHNVIVNRMTSLAYKRWRK